jgi:predicted O-methyltransferase YrrM
MIEVVMSLSDRLIKLAYPLRPAPRYGYGAPPHPLLFTLINNCRTSYAETLKSFLALQDRLLAISARQRLDSAEPCWINPSLPGLDALALYGLLALRKPRRYLEIGSGHSTKFARRAIADHRLPTQITSIDPQPRAEIDAICDRIIRQPLEDLDLAIIGELEAGDVVFFDGSHQCFTNSDVTVFFLDILPFLRPGTLIQIHDVTLPYDYPEEWMDRYYSEQYLLAVYLLARSEKAKVILPNAFITEEPQLRRILDPLWADRRMQDVESHGGSFWLEA